ncbi:MAG: universal stress protein [Gammaproteobacteria bacterium]|nr:universal stress protein [Gammaproteobacteria bacterium]
MAHFQKLLLALDLNPHSNALIGRVQQLCRDESENLHVVHVIREGMHESWAYDRDFRGNAHAQRILDHTQIKIRDILHKHGLEIPSDRIYLSHGEPAFEIKKLAAAIDADLVIVGSHYKDGDWMQLPGSTTNCVIQGISSNVMAVKI